MRRPHRVELGATGRELDDGDLEQQVAGQVGALQIVVKPAGVDWTVAGVLSASGQMDLYTNVAFGAGSPAVHARGVVLGYYTNS